MIGGRLAERGIDDQHDDRAIELADPGPPAGDEIEQQRPYQVTDRERQQQSSKKIDAPRSGNKTKVLAWMRMWSRQFAAPAFNDLRDRFAPCRKNTSEMPQRVIASNGTMLPGAPNCGQHNASATAVSIAVINPSSFNKRGNIVSFSPAGVLR